MRIAILTHPLRTNYGGILQNYALQSYLKQLGCEVTTLEDVNIQPITKYKYPIVILKRLFKRYILQRKNTIVLFEKQYKKDYALFTQHTRRFVTNHINTFDYLNIYHDIKSDSFDCYIVGSDQVWRRSGKLPIYFLDFTRNWCVKRIAYAASFGLDTWSYSDKQTRKCMLYAKKFNAISVREQSGINLCKKYLHVTALQMPDPAFLLTKDDYEALIDNRYINPIEGNLFVHILDMTQAKKEQIAFLANKYKLKTFSVNQKEHEEELHRPIQDRIQPPVEQWLDAFRNSRYVVTDSFHATVFSIIFNKSFLVLPNSDRGLTRIESLLEPLGLAHCLLADSEKKLEFFDIDYGPVNEKIVKSRQEADIFLRENIFN